ncbi:MAG: hypothetical protein E7531_03160 [Ruminococcaceae bacterium]|nr:hypothetical protein [Oscillospiraceae bacterium]
MVIYADVLVIVNMIVDYFILLLSAAINKAQYKNFRLLLGAFFGGLSSLYIFLPQQPIIIELLYRILTALLITFISFGFKKLKIFVRNAFSFLLATIVYGGAVFAIWLIFKPNSILINNTYVYYDISAVLLIIISVVIYLVITITKSILKREAVAAERCDIVFLCENRRASVKGILDTGNSVTDIMGDAAVFFVSDQIFIKLFGNNFEISKSENKNRYRIIPCATVNEKGILEGLRCDAATVICDKKHFNFNHPVLLKSNTKFSDDYDAIVNPEILMY